MEAEKIICGNCKKVFELLEQELDHICEKTGFTPRDAEHYGENFIKVQIESLKRGLEQALSKGDTDTATRTQLELDRLQTTTS